MKGSVKRLLTMLLCFTLVCVSFAYSTPVYSKTKQELQDEIDAAKKMRAAA